jgi:hypothetical protein
MEVAIRKNPCSFSGKFAGTPASCVARCAGCANGQVLVAGGISARGQVLASAEIYNPKTGNWSATGSMTAARYVAQAAVLNTSKVLVTGGCPAYNCPPALASTEVYDPASGTWSLTGSMTAPRAYHTLTLLQTGEVLAAGGYGPSGALSSTELYDDASGSWSTTGNLVTPSSGHTSTMLFTGQVLVATPSTAAQLYSPGPGTWSATGSMVTPQPGHTATRLASGRVLIAGGLNPISAIATAELYTP